MFARRSVPERVRQSGRHNGAIKGPFSSILKAESLGGLRSTAASKGGCEGEQTREAERTFRDALPGEPGSDGHHGRPATHIQGHKRAELRYPKYPAKKYL